MLTIRMQRTGRSGHAMFCVVVQDARVTRTSRKVVAYLGSYDPHAKTLILDKDKAGFYVEHGAQPSPRAARLIKAEGVKLPSWVIAGEAKQGKLRNPTKLRRDQPKAEKAPEAPVKVEEPAAVAAESAPEAETPADAQ